MLDSLYLQKGGHSCKILYICNKGSTHVRSSVRGQTELYLKREFGSDKMEVNLLTIPGQCFCVFFVSRLPLLYCLDVPYSLVVTCQVRVNLSALL